MIGQHLPVSVLGGARAPTHAEQAHLLACARCRVDTRRIRASEQAVPPEQAAGLEQTRRDLRAALQGRLQESTSGRTLGDSCLGSIFAAPDGAQRVTKVLRGATAADVLRIAADLERARRAESPALVVSTAPSRDAAGHCVVQRPWVPGVPLRSWLLDASEPGNRPDIAARRVVGHQLAAALARLHDVGVVHGRLAPANAIVGTLGAVLVDTCTWSPGARIPIGWRAPEWQERCPPPGPSVDLWALGGLLGLLATGLTPRALQLSAPEAPPGGERLLEVARALLADDPSDRPGWPHVLGTLLEDAASTAHRGPRYVDLGLLGRGGMAEVRRVHDPRLHRAVALKTLRPELPSPAEVRRRFLAEAQVTAQLQHPGIVPLHDLGTLPDGRPFFTMKEVRGRTLRSVIEETAPFAVDHVPVRGWSVRRLLDSWRRVCETVAYAHARGVVHRDLKPDNVMVGDFGEVLVLDWGLVRIGAADAPVQVPDPLLTQAGTVAGTPAYMAPEQARGDAATAGPRADVYALGALLYEILAGKPPYAEIAPARVLAAAAAGPPAQIRAAAGSRVLPDALVQICERAMARDPADRYADADALARAVTAWLEGVARRERGRVELARAKDRTRVARELQLEAVKLHAEAEEALAGVPTWAPEAEKRSGWELEERARDMEVRAALADAEAERLLVGALTHDPRLPEAHAAWVERYLEAHKRAVERRDAQAEARARIRLEVHRDALPTDHPQRRRANRWLDGQGALSLVTTPPGAQAVLLRVVRRFRRLQLEELRELGTTPLRGTPLPHGSWVVRLSAPGRATVDVPIAIGRNAHWDGRDPDGVEVPIPLPLADAVPAETCIVPPGWFASGGDDRARNALPARMLWCDGLLVQRTPVTNRQYLAFLDDLVERGREDEALAAVPRMAPGTAGELGTPLYGRRGDGGFRLVPDPEGDLWDPDWPVLMVDLLGARAYAAWWAERSGQPWRLPCELEWEKAARGVDGRHYPMGDHLDPAWAHIAGSARGRVLPARVGTYPIDASPYGVRDLAGNAADWCANAWTPGGPPLDGVRVLPPRSAEPGARFPAMGGVFDGSTLVARIGARFPYLPTTRSAILGFRLFCSLDAAR